MYVGQSISARTHAQFLNEVMGTNYKQWMKSTYPLSDYSDIWMIRFKDGLSDAGWINRLSQNGMVIEESLVLAMYSSHRRGLFARTRVVFEIVEKPGSGREYVFRGVFKCVKCTRSHHKWYRSSEWFENSTVYK